MKNSSLKSVRAPGNSIREFTLLQSFVLFFFFKNYFAHRCGSSNLEINQIPRGLNHFVKLKIRLFKHASGKKMSVFYILPYLLVAASERYLLIVVREILPVERVQVTRMECRRKNQKNKKHPTLQLLSR